jgi:hypothetical protein
MQPQCDLQVWMESSEGPAKKSVMLVQLEVYSTTQFQDLIQGVIMRKNTFIINAHIIPRQMKWREWKDPLQKLGG